MKNRVSLYLFCLAHAFLCQIIIFPFLRMRRNLVLILVMDAAPSNTGVNINFINNIKQKQTSS